MRVFNIKCLGTLTLLFMIVQHSQSYAQASTSAQENSLSTIGFLIGHQSHKWLPFANNNYKYAATTFKISYKRRILNKDNYQVFLISEPSVYRVNHRLINLFFITPNEENFMEKRERFLSPRTFYEYTLNGGFILQRTLSSQIDIYVMGTSGPMYSTSSTERLKGGFAFSNVLAIGSLFKVSSKVNLDLRTVARHTSNAGFRRPNSGHNSFGFEMGIAFAL